MLFFNLNLLVLIIILSWNVVLIVNMGLLIILNLDIHSKLNIRSYVNDIIIKKRCVLLNYPPK